MANEDYLGEYLQFFQYFDETLDPNDQLPVKLAGYKLVKKEVVGAIFNWTNQYLNDKKCPWHLISFLSRIVIEKTRQRCKKQPLHCGFNPSINAYEPLKLMQTVIEVINEVCFNYKSCLSVQTPNMAVSNPLPPPEAHYNVVSVSALKNNRRKMEDRLIVVHDLNTIFTKQDSTPSHYYAVFDGHDGEQAAAYSANHLHQFLAESTNFATDPDLAIHDAFCRTDSMFLDKCDMEKIAGGTTAVCALLLPKENTLYIAWVGDSQAAIVSQGQVLQCVRPHKPDREDEKNRIIKDGGVVIHWGVWRVNGQLGVSRAIGDAEYKPFVTAVPEIVKIPLNGQEDFFVLGSDGLWDHVPETDIARVIYDSVHSNTDKADLVSRELVNLAKQNGSCDNISVIVVFLRDPHQIAAGPRWNERVVSMDTLDNANNPFAIPNKTNTDIVNPQNKDDLLLNITDGLKKNDDLPNNDLIKMLEKSNCDRLTPEFDDEENLGPETNVDNPEDGSISPNIDVMQRQSETLNNNQNLNPFNDIEKSLTMNWNLKEDAFEGSVTPTEELCPLPTNTVNNVPQLIDAGAESDSEDEEWNYVSGEEANKENVKPLQLNSKVAEEEEDLEDNMSQLNPNAAEFVPVSPVRAVASPIGRVLDAELVLSQSPKKPPLMDELDLNVPNPVEFEKDISQKPHELEEGISNGHQVDSDNEANGTNSHRSDEFHFGPNAAPFTPVKLLDQSEASSTKAVYGDDTEQTLDITFNNSTFDQGQIDFIQKDDPMSMSFHQDMADDLNPFDLNKVHVLPDDVDEFIKQTDESNSLLNDTISDLAEHYPLGKPEENNSEVETLPVTDLDKESKIETSVQENIISPLESNIEDIVKIVEDEEQFCNVLQSSEPIEDERTETPLQDDRCLSPLVDNTMICQVDVHNLETPIQGKEAFSPIEEKETCSPIEEKEACSQIEEKEVCSPVEDKEPYSSLEDEIVDHLKGSGECPSLENEFTEQLEEKICPVEDEIQISSVQEKLIQENVIESPFDLHDFTGDQLIPTSEVKEFMTDTENIPTSTEVDLEPLVESIRCVNLESLESSEPITSVLPPNNDEFIELQSEKCDLEKAKENTENILQLDPLNLVMRFEEEYPAPDTTVNKIVDSESISTALLCDIPAQQPSEFENITTDQGSQKKEESEVILKDDVVSSSTSEERLTPRLILEVEDDRGIDFHSQPTPEFDQPLFNNSAVECLLNTTEKSVAESMGPVEVNSFIEQSHLVNVVSPLSPNLSNVGLEANQHVMLSDDIAQLSNHDTATEQKLECALPVSPPKEVQDLTFLASSPTTEKHPLVNLESPSISPVAVEIPKVKESDKKPTKGKVSLTATSKKTPTPRSLQVTAKTGGTSPRPGSSKLSAKPSPVPSKANTSSRTETVNNAKTAPKPAMSSTLKSSVSPRVPLTSRTTKPATVSKTNTTNDDTKSASKPTSTGTIKKALPATSSKTTTSTSSSRPTSSVTRAPLASARPAPTAASRSKLGSASATATKTTTTTKTSTASKPSVTAPKPSTVASKPSTTLTSKPSSTLNKAAPISKTNLKPKPTTEKQIKETANKLTASKTTVKSTTNLISKTSATKKVDEKVSGTKTTTSRMNTTNAAASRPIKKPTDASKLSTTKVGKPKQNGIAPPVVTEQILVNTSNQLNGINTDGDQRFVKDNSPMDNKLIVDNLTETAAN